MAMPIGGLEAVFGDVDWGELEDAPPTLTFADRLDVHVDDLLVELHHFPDPAHTAGDVVAWLPEVSVLFTGDLVFNGGTPFVVMGSVAGSLTAIERVRALGPAPSFRATAGLAEILDDLAEYLTFVSKLADEAKHAGLTLSTPLASAISERSPAGLTRNGSSGTCTGPTPRSTVSRPARRSTSSPRSPTW